jgi:DnaJ-class molecular chaperone
MLNEDCYRLLGISPDASEKVIRKAYRDRSKELHPDVNPSADAAHQFTKLAAALATLIDPVERLKHDDRFGYNKTTRNQDSNVKQKFSDYQKEKAEDTVNQWKVDYGKAMRIREQQRNQVIARHKRNVKIIRIAIAVVVAGLITAVLVTLSR